MINKRIFGSDIPLMVQKKLEARQKVAIGDKKPDESIQSNYTNEPEVKEPFQYSELIASNFEMQADLSSRTPFARMWTAVSLVNEREFEYKETEDSNSSDDMGDSIEQSATKENELQDIENIINQIKFKELDRVIYQVNTNNISTLENPTDSMSDVNSDLHKHIFPAEHGVDTDNNKYLKPPAGITGVESTTEGIMGTIKKTTVTFVVHNFHDFDKIYSRFFLRPGAQIFVDFGWDKLADKDGNPVKLYDPKTFFNIDVEGEQNADDVGVEKKLYGIVGKTPGITEDGFVTKCNGDVETLVGIVTEYNSTITENGSVECSLTITSKNAALLNYPKHSGKSTQQSNADNSADDELKFEKFLNTMKYKSYGGNSFVPTAMAGVSGLFIVGDDDAEDSYIQWGLLEDRIFNKYFGHGDDVTQINEDKEGKFPVRMDSSDAYTSFQNGFIMKQTEIMKAPNFCIPFFWDITYNNPRNSDNRHKAGKTDEETLEEYQTVNDASWPYKTKTTFDEKIASIKKEFNAFIKEKYKDNEDLETDSTKKVTEDDLFNQRPTRVYDGDSMITKFDKANFRVPIREIFVNIDVVKKAFTNDTNNSLRDIVDEILDAVNDHSYGLWDWKLVGEENILKINDMNFTPGAQGSVERRTQEFDNIFKFEIMSKNSIVTNYDVSLAMPSGDVGNMYAIQAMSGTPAKMNPISNVIESHSVLQTMLNKVYPGTSGADAPSNLDKIGFRYLPDLGAYNALNLQAREFNKNRKMALYRDVSNIFQGDESEQIYGVGIGAINAGTVWNAEQSDKTDDGGGMPPDTIASHNTDKQIEINMKQQKADGNIIVDNSDDYYHWKVTGDFVLDELNKSIPLPMELKLTVYGIGTLKPGDRFRVDYLPQVYMEYVYFQIINVSHELTSGGWYTTLETQFRVSPHRYEDSNSFKDASGTAKEQESLDDLLKANGVSDEKALQVISKVSIKKQEIKKKNEPVFTPAYLVGGTNKGLSENINDDLAYKWNSDAAALSTCTPAIFYSYGTPFGGYGTRKAEMVGVSKYRYTGYYQRPSTSKYTGVRPYRKVGEFMSANPYVISGNFDYFESNFPKKSPPAIRGTKKKGTIKYPKMVGKNSGGFAIYNDKTVVKVVGTNGFKDLKGYMKNIKKAEGKQNSMTYIDRLYTFEITGIGKGDVVFIPNPMYQWETGMDRWNGYGFWGARGYGVSQKTVISDYLTKPTFQGGFYRFGEKCYFGTNTGRPASWWFVCPVEEFKPAGGFGTHKVENYNFAPVDPNWDDNEFKEESQGSSPSQYG